MDMPQNADFPGSGSALTFWAVDYTEETSTPVQGASNDEIDDDVLVGYRAATAYGYWR